jgi:4-diphosphocytidyl-2-C-methyl-D-erythritol kinase
VSSGVVSRMLAPAKLTVSLRVTGVRPDGYHELDAEMVTLDLADELELDEGGAGLAVEVAPGVRAGGMPPPGQNLVERALAACGRRAAVRLTKRIPLGGGLGGGSADAAAVLRWAGCTDPDVAVGLGADVPFCVVGGRARVRGVGERVSRLPFEPRHYLLLLPPFGVETARVYRAWDEDPRDDAPNALTAAALAVEPRLARWRDALGEFAGTEPALAGSGSTWFVELAHEPAVPPPGELRAGDETARLWHARTVPSGWDGEAEPRAGD